MVRCEDAGRREGMSRLIDATALRNKVLTDAGASDMPSDWYKGVQYVIDYIVHAPTVEERKMGKWINAYPDIEPNPMFMYGICSVCGFEQSISDKLKYCPNCGARMVQEGEEP